LILDSRDGDTERDRERKRERERIMLEMFLYLVGFPQCSMLSFLPESRSQSADIATIKDP